MTNPRMGRGIRALLSTTSSPESMTTLIDVGEISPNPHQPRRSFDPEALQALSETIKQNGLLQPIVVRRGEQGNYEIISGERRWRAAQAAQMQEIPALVREDVSDQQMLTLALIENVQRRDLDPIEKAEGFSKLVTFGLTQEKVAALVGMSRVSVTNLIRLLDLPEDVQQLVSRGLLKMGHARAILAARDVDIRRKIAIHVVKNGLSVRETEELVARSQASSERSARRRSTSERPAWIPTVESQIGQHFGLKVRLNHGQRGSGVIEMHYGSEAELQGVLEKMGLGEESLRL